MAAYEKEYLFVYGTLMNSYKGNPFKEEFLTSATFLGKAYTYGKLFLVDYYPGLVKNDSGENYVTYGEIFQLTKPLKLLKQLDEYEDYYSENLAKSLYVREKADCFFIDKAIQVRCWLYYYNKPVDKLKLFRNGAFLTE